MNQKPFPQPPELPVPAFLSPDRHISVGAADGIPVGAVMAFAGLLDPTKRPGNDYLLLKSNWAPCDGRLLKMEEYPELFEVLGYVYGGKEETFNIPDYGGYFLRGVPLSDASNGKDPDMKNRTLPSGGIGGAPEEAGSIQDDAIQSHEHNLDVLALSPFAAPSNEGPLSGTIKDPIKRGDPSNMNLLQNKVNVSDKETRPKNMYVHFIIKLR